MTNGNDKCKNCGGDEAIHHYQTDQCPVGGVEAPVGREQEWKTSTFAAEIPFDPPSRMAKDITIREYFAAMAMQGMQAENPSMGLRAELLARYAVEMSDALIEALNKEQA